jgi:hypothetical protein
LKKCAPDGGYEVPNCEELAITCAIQKLETIRNEKDLFFVLKAHSMRSFTQPSFRGDCRHVKGRGRHGGLQIEGQTTSNVHLAEVTSSISSQRTATQLCEMLLAIVPASVFDTGFQIYLKPL